MKKQENICDPCERDFEHKVNELVKEGSAPSRMERMKKEHEVKAAFNGSPAPARKKAPVKQPAMTGTMKKK